jgi:CheY-like chemotaxis protein
MPQEDGYYLIRQVRILSQQEGGGAPAVALTAFARSEDRQRALRAGYQFHGRKTGGTVRAADGLCQPGEPDHLKIWCCSRLGLWPSEVSL